VRVHLDSCAELQIATLVAFTSPGVQQRKLRRTFLLLPLLHISFAGSLWHPCPVCAERLSLRSGHPDGQGANFQTLWLFESDFDEHVDALAAQTLDDIGPLSPCVSYCCALFYTPLISAPSPAGHLFCFVSRSPLFCRKAGPRRPTDSDNWQGLLSPLQKFPISVLLLSSQRAPYGHGINDFIGNSISAGHSQAGQTYSPQSLHTRRLPWEEPIDSLTSFISKSGCTLQELCVTGQITAISAASYRQAFPAISKFSFPEQL
jgi:hypothetical protein